MHKRISIVILVYEDTAVRLKVHQYFFLELRIDYICSKKCMQNEKIILFETYIIYVQEKKILEN